MAASGFVSLWEFAVKATRQAEFERLYGPDGGWAQLFRLAPGYVGTELLNDRASPLRYVTIDHWASIDHWRKFRQQFAEQYESLDRECEGLTTQEAPLGEFDAMSGPFAG